MSGGAGKVTQCDRLGGPLLPLPAPFSIPWLFCRIVRVCEFFLVSCLLSGGTDDCIDDCWGADTTCGGAVAVECTGAEVIWSVAGGATLLSPPLLLLTHGAAGGVSGGDLLPVLSELLLWEQCRLLSESSRNA